MIKLISLFCGWIILCLSTFYVVKKLSKSNIKISKKKYFVFILIYMCEQVFTYNLIDNFIKIPINFITLSLLIHYTFSFSFSTSVIYSFFSYGMIFVAEFICVGFLQIFFYDEYFVIKDTVFNTFFSNLLISSIVILMANIFSIKKIIKEIYIKKNKKLVFLLFFVIFALGILTYLVYFQVSVKYILLVNFILILLYTSLAISTVYEANINEKLKEDYEIILKDINDYEILIKKLRKKTHDNVNNLLAIKGLCRSVSAKEYIDLLLGSQEKEDADILSKVKNIPYGGLQGIIYKKILQMKQKKINFFIYCSDDLVHLKKIPMDKNKNLCTIVGILLDNAIEATMNLSKNKNIAIVLFKENKKLVVEISNTYIGNIPLEDIEVEGFSTKGKNHGFGLSVVKEIIDECKDIENYKKIVGDVFVQCIKIKL